MVKKRSVFDSDEKIYLMTHTKEPCPRCGGQHKAHLEGMSWCYECTTNEEVAERVKSPIIKEMEGLSVGEKVFILRQCWKEEKLRNRRKVA